MKNVTGHVENEILTITLSGHIDSVNASQIEDEINDLKNDNPDSSIVIDCEPLEYISSAGLRIILRLRKEHQELKIINVSSEVYEIFDMTGFTEMIPIEKGFRKLSIDGCEVIGRGANGTVYRIDRDTIIKVYRDSETLKEVERERELARKAFIMGIPTAIPYDVVRVGNTYGSVFELLNADSFSSLIAKNPDELDHYIDLYIEVLKKIHSTEITDGSLPSKKKYYLEKIGSLKSLLPDGTFYKLQYLISSIPDDNHMIHGDYHTKNIMLQDGEALLIDMDTLSLGDPIFEFSQMYDAYYGFSELNPDNDLEFLGVPFEICDKIWKKTLRVYFNTEDEKILNEVYKRSEVVGQITLLDWTLRHNPDKEHVEKQKELSIKHIIDNVQELESLSLKELIQK